MPGKEVVLAAGASVALLYAVFQLGLAFYNRYRENTWRRNLDYENDTNNTTDNTDEYNSWNRDERDSDDNMKCVICLEVNMNRINARALICGHMFHKHCLLEMIRATSVLGKYKCPVCRIEF